MDEILDVCATVFCLSAAIRDVLDVLDLFMLERPRSFLLVLLRLYSMLMTQYYLCYVR